MGFAASKPDPDFPPITPILVPRTLKGYPAAQLPESKPGDVINDDMFAPVDARCQHVIVTGDTSYEDLLKELTWGLKTEVEKVRAIFTWLGAQRIYDSLYPGIVDPMTPRGYMKVIKKKMGSYTEFFTLLCRSADIPAVLVRGQCKRSHYEPGHDLHPTTTTAWVAVYVDGQWRIVHPDWAFRGNETMCEPTDKVGAETVQCLEQNHHGSDKNHSVSKIQTLEIPQNFQRSNSLDKGHSLKRMTSIDLKDDCFKEKIEKCVDEFFFMTDPEEFKYLAWSEKVEWQLTEEPWSFDDFCRAPYVYSAYFTTGAKLKNDVCYNLAAPFGSCTLPFKHSAHNHVRLGCLMFAMHNYSYIEDDVKLDRFVCVEYNKCETNIHIRLPSRGIYKLTVYAGNSYRLTPIAEFCIDCVGLADDCHGPFPVLPPIGVGFGQRAASCDVRATSHSTGVITTDLNSVAINLFYLNPENIDALLRHQSISDSSLRACVRKEVHHQQVEFCVDIPEIDHGEEFLLQVYVKAADCPNSMTNVANYLITQCPHLHSETAGHPLPRSREGSLTKMVSIDLDNAEDDRDLYVKNRAITDKMRRLEGEFDEASERRNRRDLEVCFTQLLCLCQDIAQFKQELLLLVLLYEQEITRARSDFRLDLLMILLAEAGQSVACTHLRNTDVVMTSHDFLSKQHRVRQYCDVIQTLTRHTVSNIAYDDDPDKMTFDIMKSTFILLGEDELAVQKWFYIQALLSVCGRRGIIARINRFNIDQVKPHISSKVKDTLHRYSIEGMTVTDTAVTALYLWAYGVVSII